MEYDQDVKKIRESLNRLKSEYDAISSKDKRRIMQFRTKVLRKKGEMEQNLDDIIAGARAIEKQPYELHKEKLLKDYGLFLTQLDEDIEEIGDSTVRKYPKSIKCTNTNCKIKIDDKSIIKAYFDGDEITCPTCGEPMRRKKLLS
jgi:hypothetical protein